MATLLDYLDWRGDLTLAQAPFNEVDNLILSILSYVDFREIVPGPGSGQSVPLWSAVRTFQSQFPVGEKIQLGVLISDEIPAMLEKLVSCRRFRNMELSGYMDTLDAEKEEQFAALTVGTGDRALYLAFRGTDDSLAGWKEDFNMAFMPEVPAQRKALQYVQIAAAAYPRKHLRLGGHSKGGNLAVYGAVFCPPGVQRRILDVWSNDGPGFQRDILDIPQHQRIEDRIHSIVPKSSVVGMLLEHEERYTVVDSNQVGLLQHDGFSWQVMADHFITLRQVSRQACRSRLEIREMLHEMTLEQRERFVNALFDVLSASGAATLTDLREDSFKAVIAAAKAVKDLDRDMREGLLEFLYLLCKGNLRLALEDIHAEGEKHMAQWRNAIRKWEEES